jgi:hypothetical protein
MSKPLGPRKLLARQKVQFCCLSFKNCEANDLHRGEKGNCPPNQTCSKEGKEEDQVRCKETAEGKCYYEPTDGAYNFLHSVESKADE